MPFPPSAPGLVDAGDGTPLCFGPSTSGIFDALPDEEARRARYASAGSVSDPSAPGATVRIVVRRRARSWPGSSAAKMKRTVAT